MELTQLYQFSVLARLNSVTRAAQKLYITQPALSNTISRLENELGVKLFTRLGNRIELNDAGALFLEYVDGALGRLEEGVASVRELASTISWDVSFSVPNGGLVTDLKYSFIQEHPDVRLHQHFFSAQQTKEALLSGMIQFALTYRPILDDQIQWSPLAQSEIVLLVSEQHPLLRKQDVFLRDVEDFPLLTSESSQDLADVFISHCKKVGFTPRILFSGDEPRLISSIMKDGHSILVNHKVLTSLEPPVKKEGQSLDWVPMRQLRIRDYSSTITIGIAKLREGSMSRYAALLYDCFISGISEITSDSSFSAF